MHPRVTSLAFLLIAAFTCVLGGCSSAKNLLAGLDQPSARIVSADLQNFDLQAATVMLGVEVANPYAVDVPLTNLDYTLGSQGKQLVAGTFDAGQLGAGAIPARGKKVLQVPASVNFAQALGILQGVRPGAVVPYSATVGLGVNKPAALGGGKIDLPPLKKDGQLPIPAPPEVSIQNIAWDKLSLDRAGGTVKLNIKNTNQFAADLQQLGYSLNLGGSKVAQASIAKAINLAPGQSGTIDIPISFAPRDAGLGLLSVLTGKSAAYGLSGDMKVNTPFGPLSLPYSSSGQAGMTGK